MGKDVHMSGEERNRISFYIACIGAFAERFTISNAVAYNYLSQYKGLDFIYDFYDIEHTFPIDDVADDMQKYVKGMKDRYHDSVPWIQYGNR